MAKRMKKVAAKPEKKNAIRVILNPLTIARGVRLMPRTSLFARRGTRRQRTRAAAFRVTLKDA